MYGRNTHRLLVGVLLAALACYTSRAPRNWLPTPAESQSDPYGGWIKVSAKTPTGPREIEGELIAAERDTLHVMAFIELVSVPLDSVTEVKLEAFRIERVGFATWTALGVLSSLSHGYVFVLTAPVWILGGTFATSSYSRAPLIVTPTVEALRPYARFPQGFPPGLDRKTLQAAADR